MCGGDAPALRTAAPRTRSAPPPPERGRSWLRRWRVGGGGWASKRAWWWRRRTRFVRARSRRGGKLLTNGLRYVIAREAGYCVAKLLLKDSSYYCRSSFSSPTHPTYTVLLLMKEPARPPQTRLRMLRLPGAAGNHAMRLKDSIVSDYLR